MKHQEKERLAGIEAIRKRRYKVYVYFACRGVVWLGSADHNPVPQHSFQTARGGLGKGARSDGRDETAGPFTVARRSAGIEVDQQRQAPRTIASCTLVC